VQVLWFAVGGITKKVHRVIIAVAMALLLPGLALTQEPKTIKLNEPDKQRGLPFMEALSVKPSAQEWSDRELSLQDLSDLLWAANGKKPARHKEAHGLISPKRA